MSTPIKRAGSGKFFVLRLLSYVADGKEFIHSLKKWNTEFVSFKFGGKHSTQKLLLLALEGRKKNQGCQLYLLQLQKYNRKLLVTFKAIKQQIAIHKNI